MTHQGKIGLLPSAIRDELNHRLLDGEPGSKILPWLNNLPAVVKIMEENAEGLRVTDNNLSNWRHGGYAAWLRRHEHVSDIHDLTKWSIELARASGGQLTEGAAAILAGQILEVLEGVRALMQKTKAATAGPGVPSPDGSASHPHQEESEKLAGMAEAIASLTSSVAALRIGDQNNRKLEQNADVIKLKEERLQQTADALELAWQRYRGDFIASHLKWANDAKAQAILAGAGNTDAKTEQLGALIFGDDWKNEP